MTQPSKISVERPTLKICGVKFANPSVNLIVPETFFQLSVSFVKLLTDLGIHDIEKRLGHYLGMEIKIYKVLT